MLSIFPSLLSFGLISPFLLRVAAGLFILVSAKLRFKRAYKWASLVHAATGILLVIGMYTQVAALVGLLVVAFEWKVCSDEKPLEPAAICFNVLLMIALVSLLFTGAGFFAFDLPL